MATQGTVVIRDQNSRISGSGLDFGTFVVVGTMTKEASVRQQGADVTIEVNVDVCLEAAGPGHDENRNQTREDKPQWKSIIDDRSP